MEIAYWRILPGEDFINEIGGVFLGGTGVKLLCPKKAKIAITCIISIIINVSHGNVSQSSPTVSHHIRERDGVIA